MSKKLLVCLLLSAMILSAASADELSLGEVNRFLNSSAKLGEGSKANAVAVIPFNHIDGPKEEDLFYAFVPFKYVARNYVKYQVTFISCTCRPADLNVWSTAYLELTLPSSGKIEDAAVKTFSFDRDSTGHYLGGFWGDSDPPPTSPKSTFEKFKAEMLPYYVGKTCAQIMKLGTIDDIKDYNVGEGRENLTLDGWTGATVSSNNVLRILEAMFVYHATDQFFDGDPKAVEMRKVFESKKAVAAAVATASAAKEGTELPAPVDTKKTYKANKDDTEETVCAPGNFGPTCSSINNENLLQYLGRSDVMYIDLRDFEDYAKKHLRNFECIPYLSLIFNADAHKDASLPQLYGGTTDDPIPVYKESDEILQALFPKNKNIFLMCQGGGRVNNMMKILKARGWDMSKVYNIGGMAHYAGPAYKSITTDTPEIVVKATYNFEGLTRIAK
ncbi:MAG: rhodanese-like domain-containing protein [Synergistales bacterium]|nr:rhodanese-like domain-containing protein [Synergistales bacterium]